MTHSSSRNAQDNEISIIKSQGRSCPTSATGVVCTSSGEIISVNGQWPECLPGQPDCDSLHSVFPIALLPDIEEQFSVSLSKNAHTTRDYTVGDATLRIDAVPVPPRQGEDPGPDILSLCIQDITALEQAREHYHKVEKLFHSFVSKCNDGFWLMDADMHTVDVNNAVLEMLGYTRKEMLALSPYDLIVDMDDDVLLSKENACDLDSHRSCEALLRHVDGHDVHTLFTMHHISDENDRLIWNLALLTDITPRKVMERQLAHQQLHDPLTGLPNRNMCMNNVSKALERAKRRQEYQYAVLFVDVDRFKTYNDSLGHRNGDKLLTEIAGRLLDSVRTLDTVSRLGSDEFLVLLEEINSPKEAVMILKRIRRNIQKPIHVDGHELLVTVSIGVVVNDHGADTAEDLVRNAELAVRRSKQVGQNRFKVFKPQLLDQAMKVLTIENDLRRGIANNELFLQYQPILTLQEEKLIGFEALVRWRHPDKGIVPPNEFIPVAEETMLINDLGFWVLENACRTLSQWRADIPQAKDVVVTVNISSRQFQQPDIVEKVKRLLDEHDLPPNRLKLELTETTVMLRPESAKEMLMQLSFLGVNTSIDDFGTGYSSMSYLQKFPLDHLKIDLSFVRNIHTKQESQEIIKGIISLAHALRMEVIAEGVELEVQRDILAGLKCEYGQGYLYSKPLSEEDVPDFIREKA